MSVRNKGNHEIYITLKDLGIEPKVLYRLLSNSKQVTSGISNRQWWKTRIDECIMWSIFKRESVDVYLIITSHQKLSELDIRVRLKRISGMKTKILFGFGELVFPTKIIELKHYKHQGKSIHPKEVIQYVDEKRKELCIEV